MSVRFKGTELRPVLLEAVVNQCRVVLVKDQGVYFLAERGERGGVPGSGVTARGSEVFAVVALQGHHGGREVGGSSEIFGKVGVATLQPNHEEDPNDPRQDAAFRAA